jgi:hypothetical protein
MSQSTDDDTGATKIMLNALGYPSDFLTDALLVRF